MRQAGEDIAIGDCVLAAGKRILPAELGVLGSLGIGEVSVRRRLRVAFFSTGDELRALGEPLAPGEVYDSNRHTLYGMLTRLGVELIDMGVIPDERDAVRDAFHEAARIGDAIISTGGTGVTGRDGTPEAVQPLLDKEIAGFGEVFRSISYQEIKTSTMQSRALAGVANATYIFCLPGSSGACKTARDTIIAIQLDYRTRPCNLVELMPRLLER